VPAIEEFGAEHARRNGYERPGAEVEVVAVRATARRASVVDTSALPTAERAPVVGPAVVAEPDCTIWVPPGWRGDPGAAGSLVLTRSAS
jgi:N-methylhydantoinase A/oxoprolinase/acetone carboxylase beta subunit